MVFNGFPKLAARGRGGVWAVGRLGGWPGRWAAAGGFGLGSGGLGLRFALAFALGPDPGLKAFI